MEIVSETHGVFGSPSEGVPEILAKEELTLKNGRLHLNMIANQGVENGSNRGSGSRDDVDIELARGDVDGSSKI